MNLDDAEFAVVDIETTGARPMPGAITEIGVVVMNRHGIIGEWSSLVRPAMRIDLYVSRLTGITNQMVADAPSFGEISGQLLGLLQGKVFVAHQVNFDYTYLREAFRNEGVSLELPRLCTVRAARAAFPGMSSYGLGNLSKTLAIPLDNHHRALSDAKAAALILLRAIERNEEAVQRLLSKEAKQFAHLPPFLPVQAYEKLPAKTGVYYLLNKAGDPLYIGKAIDIKKRIRQHFSPSGIIKSDPIIFREIYDIRFTLTGTALISLLLEAQEIGRFWPPLNKALKSRNEAYGLVNYTDRNGRTHVAVDKIRPGQQAIGQFGSYAQAQRYLLQVAGENELCLHCLGILPQGQITSAENCPEHRDEQHEALLSKLHVSMLSGDDFILAGKGRTDSEWSYIWISGGKFLGYGFTKGPLNAINHRWLSCNLVPMAHTTTSDAIIQAHLLGNFAETLIEIPRLS